MPIADLIAVRAARKANRVPTFTMTFDSPPEVRERMEAARIAQGLPPLEPVFRTMYVDPSFYSGAGRR